MEVSSKIIQIEGYAMRLMGYGRSFNQPRKMCQPTDQIEFGIIG